MPALIYFAVLVLIVSLLSFWSKPNLRLFLWLIVAGHGMALFSCRDCMDNTGLFLIVGSVNSIGWIMMWMGNVYINCFLDEQISWTKFPLKRFIAGFIAVVIYTPLVILLLTASVKALFDIGSGSISNVIFSSFLITIVISLFMSGRSFLFNWRQAAINAERLERENISAKYENLKSQVNPHFLFNSLNALTNLVYEDQDKAAKFIKQLSEVYRYVLDTREQEVVPLEEELKFLRSYLFLQQIRFGGKLKVDINLNGTTSMIAPLALQMLVENAIKHNVISEETPLLIRIYREDDFIVVENTLQPRQATNYHSPGVGLENIRKRYEFLRGELRVQVNKGQDDFTVKLPVIAMTDQSPNS